MRKPKRKDVIKMLSANLILNERIETTKRKAKMVKPFLERLVTRAKKERLSDYRYLLRFLPKRAANKLFYELCSKYKERKGGYLRIVPHSKKRLGDGAETATIEFV